MAEQHPHVSINMSRGQLKDSVECLKQREEMIERQLIRRGIKDPKVLNAFHRVPRQFFVDPPLVSRAYEDQPLAIGFGQTISQPFIVAFMTEQLGLNAEDQVLEIGTGSGYQTAILSELVKAVYSVEINEALYVRARGRLNALGYQNVFLKCGDGSHGWQEHAPFRCIIVTAGAPSIPRALSDQLSEGGKLIIPIGEGDQDLVVGVKTRGVLVTKQVMRVRFVPFLSKSQPA